MKPKNAIPPADLTGIGTVPGSNLFAVLDGAAMADLPDYLRRNELSSVCLYRGALAPDLARAAPYIVQFAPHDMLARDFAEHGWREHWGILCHTAASLRDLRRHCRRFLMVMGPGARPMYFRYYDPRILPVFLHSCDGRQLRDFFGPIRAYYAAQPQANAFCRLTLAGGILCADMLPWGAASDDGGAPTAKGGGHVNA